LAQHFAAVHDGDAGRRAAEYFMLAGHDAIARNAPAVAATFFGEALSTLTVADDEPRRIDALIGLGNAQFHAADSAYRSTLLDAAHRATAIDDADRLAAAA